MHNDVAKHGLASTQCLLRNRRRARSLWPVVYRAAKLLVRNYFPAAFECESSSRMFRPVQSNVSFPALEAEILRFWQESGIYEKSLAQRAGAPKFIFYEGPPTANGMPHPGHCLTRAIKDLFPRTARCAATNASERPAGIRTACRWKSKSAKSSASTAKSRSKPTASNPSFKNANKAFGVI